MSSPPPPLRIAGVAAMATSAKGAKSMRFVSKLLGLPKLGSTTMFATSSTRERSRANAKLRVRRNRRISDTRRLLLSEVARDEHRPRQGAATELHLELALLEHEHPVHQLDQLVDLGREHHDGDPLGRELREQVVDVELRAEVDAAGRVVDQQDGWLGGESAGDDDLLLVPAREGHDPVAGASELDAKPVDVPGQTPLAGRRSEEAGDGVARDRRQREVLADGKYAEDGLVTPFPGDVHDSGAGGGRRRVDRDLARGRDPDDAARDASRAAQCPQEHVLPLPLEACKPEDLAGAEIEVDLL